MRVCLYACVRAMLVLLTEDLEVNPEFVELTPFRCPVFHVRQLGYGYKHLQITSLASRDRHLAHGVHHLDRTQLIQVRVKGQGLGNLFVLVCAACFDSRWLVTS